MVVVLIKKLTFFKGRFFSSFFQENEDFEICISDYFKTFLRDYHCTLEGQS